MRGLARVRAEIQPQRAGLPLGKLWACGNLRRVRAVPLCRKASGTSPDRGGIPCRSRESVAFRFRHSDARCERCGIPSLSGGGSSRTNVLALTIFVGVLIVPQLGVWQANFATSWLTLCSVR